MKESDIMGIIEGQPGVPPLASERKPIGVR
jgi:hypothetical protein